VLFYVFLFVLFYVFLFALFYVFLFVLFYVLLFVLFYVFLFVLFYVFLFVLFYVLLFVLFYVFLFVLFYVLFVCKCVLPPCDNPIAVNKYVNVNTNKTCHSATVSTANNTQSVCRFNAVLTGPTLATVSSALTLRNLVNRQVSNDSEKCVAYIFRVAA
jgi:hypothetical protein